VLEPPRFLANGMNGDIARWLRIMGFDCIYENKKNIDDKTLIDMALKEGRILLTNDKELFRLAIKRGVKAHYTSGEDIVNKLRPIINKYGLHKYTGKIRYRCSICNTILEKMDSERANIPEYIKRRFKIVYVCPNCGKTYWKGSHWTKILNTLKMAGYEVP